MEWMDRRPRSTKHAIVEQQRVFPKQPAVLREWPIFYRVGRPNQRRYTFPDRSYTMSIEKVLYRAHARATGGRDGRAVVPDSGLDLRLTTPHNRALPKRIRAAMGPASKVRRNRAAA
jgi:hypothetical protein